MRSYTFAFALIITGLVVAPSAGLSGEGRDQDQTVKPDGLGPVHKRLAELAGTWDVALEYTLGDKKQAGKATCEAKLIMDGRFLQQDYHSRFQGKPFHVMQILGYDSSKKKTVEIMIDSLSTGLMHNEGTISGDVSVITNRGESIDPRTQKPYTLRTVTTIVDGDHFRLEWFRTNDGGKEVMVVSMTHTRKKS
jgi:hypothetical protein